MKFKIQPLYVFILILVLLILSIFLSRSSYEGFIAFNKTTPSLNQVYIPQYTNNNYLYKVYDSIYFDSANGNVIELFGNPFSETIDKTITTSNVDTIGSSLTNIVLMTRPLTQNAPLNITHYDKTKGNLAVDASLIEKTVTSSHQYSIVPNSTNYKSNSNITYNYQVLYIPVGKDTIMHIYDCTNTSNVNIGTYLFRNGQTPVISMYKGGIPSNLGSFVIDNHENNNSYVDEPLYDSSKSKKTYQVTRNVLFDTTNRNLILKKSNSISVYNGSVSDDSKPKLLFSNITERGAISNTASSFNDRDFSTFEVLYILDTEHNSCVLYIPFPSSKKTVIAVISMDPTVLGLITVRNVVVFNPESENGVEGNNISIKKSEPNVECSNNDTTSKLTKCNVGDGNCGDVIVKKDVEKKDVEKKDVEKKDTIPTLDSIIADYYSRYFNSNTPAIVVNGVKQYSNDFMLKTQTIPPICPACPACPHGGNNSTCINCGGNGGSGMLKIDSSNNILAEPGTTTIPATTPAAKFVVAPVAAPVMTPFVAPVVAPVVSPVVSSPVMTPFVAPVVAPVSAPVMTPFVTPAQPATKPVVDPLVKTITSPIVTPAGLKPNLIEPNTQSRNALPVQNNSYSNYGATEERPSSHFMPVTSDFSAFGR